MNVEIVGINRISQAPYSDMVMSGLPLLQDTSRDQVWVNWGATYRDVRILNSRNELAGVYNLTKYDLQIETNKVALRNLLLAAAKMVDADGNQLPDDWELRFLKTSRALPLGDSDLDGRDNFTEYAFGLDPSDPRPSIPVQTKFLIRSGKPVLTLEFRRRAGGVLDYSIETSTDTRTWTKLNVYSLIKNLCDGTGVSLATYSLPAFSDSSARFFRVRATPAKR